jgi:archaellum component FlaC
MEESYICIKDTMDFFQNNSSISKTSNVKSQWLQEIRTEDNYKAQISSIPESITHLEKRVKRIKMIVAELL